MTDRLNDQTWALVAAACELLALSLRYPTAELADAVADGEWAEAAIEIAGSLGIELPSSFAAEAKARMGEDAGAVLRSLRVEATRLFVGSPDVACSPYEGVWRAADDGVEALLFVNPHSMDVELFCKSCGLGRPEGTNEPLDHVATEVELLQHLASLEAGIVDLPCGLRSEGLPGGSASEAFAKFMDDHARVWMPRFAEALAERANLPFYRAVAFLLAAFLSRK